MNERALEASLHPAPAPMPSLSGPFLCGSLRVCRYVEEYKTEDIEVVLGLNQQRLGEMALLLGSDYTEVGARPGCCVWVLCVGKPNIPTHVRWRQCSCWDRTTPRCGAACWCCVWVLCVGGSGGCQCANANAVGSAPGGVQLHQQWFTWAHPSVQEATRSPLAIGRPEARGRTPAPCARTQLLSHVRPTARHTCPPAPQNPAPRLHARARPIGQHTCPPMHPCP